MTSHRVPDAIVPGAADQPVLLLFSDGLTASLAEWRDRRCGKHARNCRFVHYLRSASAVSYSAAPLS
jgi:hypothetical protein